MLAVLAASMAVAAVAGVVWLVGWSEVMALETVRVEGVDGELAGVVEQVADAPLGDPLVRVDTDAVAARVRDLPELASVSVARSWPRTVVISVTPRVAAAAITDADTWWLVDASGVLFGAAAEQPADLPVLEAPVDAAAGATRAAGVAVLDGLPANLRDLVEAVSAESEADVRIELVDGATVLWGRPELADRKAEVLLALLDQEASIYDVSAPERPAIVP
ncbi:MAG TPA: FtsQ-type POTRA domain-containing protein [Jiangellaceae bacterium]